MSSRLQLKRVLSLIYLVHLSLLRQLFWVMWRLFPKFALQTLCDLFEVNCNCVFLCKLTKMFFHFINIYLTLLHCVCRSFDLVFKFVYELLQFIIFCFTAFNWQLNNCWCPLAHFTLWLFSSWKFLSCQFLRILWH